MSNSLQLTQPAPLRSIITPTLFGNLRNEQQVDLINRAPLRHFSDQQIMQQQGDKARGFWVIESGNVRIGMFKPDGEFRVLAILSDGDSYGELALFADAPRAVDALAEGAVRARWIDAAAFEEAIRDDPATMRKMVGTLSMQLQEVLGLIAALGTGSGHARIAATLVNLGKQLPQGRMIHIGQQELGELTGLTRATVNKSLKKLEQAGAIGRHYGRLELLDLQALKQAANAG